MEKFPGMPLESQPQESPKPEKSSRLRDAQWDRKIAEAKAAIAAEEREWDEKIAQAKDEIAEWDQKIQAAKDLIAAKAEVAEMSAQLRKRLDAIRADVAETAGWSKLRAKAESDIALTIGAANRRPTLELTDEVPGADDAVDLTAYAEEEDKEDQDSQRRAA